MSEGTLRALDPNLPLLASQAAIELDSLIRKKKSNLSATKRLADLLTNSLGSPPEAPTKGSLMDPTTATLINRVLHESRWGSPKTTSELIDQAWSIARGLHETDADADRELLKKIQAFCAVLSECAAAHLQSVYSRRPAHEYRR